MTIPVADTDQLFEALADETRRRLLVDLLHEQPQHYSNDATDPPDRPSAGGGGRLRSCPTARDHASLEGTRLRMHHVHLPKLADCGLVEWDRSDGTVRRGPTFEELKPVLEQLDREE